MNSLANNKVDISVRLNDTLQMIVFKLEINLKDIKASQVSKQN